MSWSRKGKEPPSREVVCGRVKSGRVGFDALELQKGSAGGGELERAAGVRLEVCRGEAGQVRKDNVEPGQVFGVGGLAGWFQGRVTRPDFH